VGAVLVLLFFLAGLYLVARRQHRALCCRAMPWLSIGAYAVLSGLVVAVGRSAWGVHVALANKYAPFSLYLAVALLFLVPIVVEDMSTRVSSRATRVRAVRGVGLGCLALCLVLHGVSAAGGFREAMWRGRMLRYGKSCLLFVNAYTDATCLTRAVFPAPESLKKRANELDRLGYLRPRLLHSPRLESLTAYDPANHAVGAFDTFIPRRHRVVAGGWALKPSAHEPADSVILARRRPGGHWAPLAFVPVSLPHRGSGRGGARPQGYARWRYRLAKSDASPLPVQIGAWAFDAQRGWALPLEGVHTLEPDAPLSNGPGQ
jgi:hypothetical protein